MAINFYKTEEEGLLTFFETTYQNIFDPDGGPPDPSYVYFDFATTIADARVMTVRDINPREVDFGFVHDGIRIPTCPYVKDPDGQTDFGTDWTNWLHSGEAITDTSWSIANDDSSIEILAEDSVGNKQAALIGGGLSGKVYTLTCRVTTDQDRIEDRSMYIICADK